MLRTQILMKIRKAHDLSGIDAGLLKKINKPKND
jgi:hypothetical protein